MPADVRRAAHANSSHHSQSDIAFSHDLDPKATFIGILFLSSDPAPRQRFSERGA
jgi:hypothetical protein